MHSASRRRPAWVPLLMLGLAAPGFGATGQGDSPAGPLDTAAPQVASVIAPTATTTFPVNVTVSGVSDSGGAAVAGIQLWYRTLSSQWLPYATVQSAALTSATFAFSPPALPVTTTEYLFDTVAWDNLGNRTANPTGGGRASITFTQNSAVGDWRRY